MSQGMDLDIYFLYKPYSWNNLHLLYILVDNFHKDFRGSQANIHKQHSYFQRDISHLLHMAMDSKDPLVLEEV